MKKILFLEENFSMQGTTKALIDYAYFNKKILKNESILAFGKKQNNHPWDQPYHKNILENTFKSLSNNFNVLFYENDYSILENHIKKSNLDALYCIKSGEPTGFHTKSTKFLTHAVFPQPKSNIHGDRFAFVSKWLSQQCSNGEIPYVPHMVNVPKTNETEAKDEIRKIYNIPKDAFVYGRIGGYQDFNLPFVYDAIKNILNKRKDIYFLMICTAPFYKHERVIYVDPIYDIKNKFKHIACCDAMIHARHHGETFGLAIAEFCAMNKPNITWKHGIGKGYIEILKNDAIYYDNENDLMDIFLNFSPEKGKDYNSYREFSPKNVMKQFETVFLDNL